ncbi:phosphoinositide 3-kinase regulatory subunit 6 isoform X2 [Esox lucius]|uniref:phosphoinositide 3-kinase regulatory subunit 6 isoform X2 n=1 Tax=Esox lucius TaxID=8010 RepID=UPI001476B4B8|nr:phosphoinositide 3-kinase regulatory subunit 6 isoform X2 [Esox lucius]
MSTAVESSMYNNIQAMLRQAASSCNRGMLRWTLHKKAEKEPSNSILLIRVLVKELEKVEGLDNNMHIIPLLHTIFYVIIQSGHISGNLLQRVYECFKRLLTHPEPYCTIALKYIRSMKMEQITPGALYLRRVIAEHSLTNKYFPHQEKVVVFADPAVLSRALWQAVRADLEQACPSSDTLTKQRLVLLHILQAGLLKTCNGPILTQALEDLGEDVEQFFQEVVLAVEHSVENHVSGRDQYQTRLQKIYSEILTAVNQDPKAGDILSNAPLPSPAINFHLWTNEEELLNELVNFTLSINPSERRYVNQEDEGEEGGSKRVSLQSDENGKEKELPDMEMGEHSKPFTLSWLPCFRVKVKQQDHMWIKEEQNHTVHIVMMGDDRVLGRLAKALYYIRKQEAKQIMSTKRVNLEIYYVPVTDEPIMNSPRTTTQVQNNLSLALFLGKIDPWYESNINSLGIVIPKLAVTQSSHSRSSEPNHFLADVLSYYLRCGLQPVYFPLYSVKISVSGMDGSPVEEVFVSHLEAEFPDLKTLNKRQTGKSLGTCGALVSVNYRKVSLSKQEVIKEMSVISYGVVVTAISPNETDLDVLTVNFDTLNSRCCMIRTQNISIRILEDKTFNVCLDKDYRRTYTNVQSMEISPCLDPVNCIQTISKSEGTGLSKYFCKSLHLPINTFTGSHH